MRLALVAHDAGGANILASLARRHSGRFDWSVIAAGPAASILSGLVPEFVPSAEDADVDDLVSKIRAEKPDLILTGTGWQSCLERNGIEAAHRLGVPVVSILDHWVNFRSRFGSPDNWAERLPDRVLVGDAYALEQAKADGFPQNVLGVIENPYLEEFALRSGTFRTGRQSVPGVIRVLFLGEPLSVSFAGGGQTAPAVPDVAAAIVDMVLARPDVCLVVRAHPSESRSRYDFLQRCLDPARVELHGAADAPLEQDMAQADTVVGMSSMALLAAVASGCRVIAYLPEGLDFCLPHREIRCCRTPDEFFRAFATSGEGVQSLDLRLYSRSLSDLVQELCSPRSKH